MKWEGNRQSDNVEDARESGGGGGLRLGGGRGVGLGTVVIALLAGWAFGINPFKRSCMRRTNAPCPQPISRARPGGRATSSSRSSQKRQRSERSERTRSWISGRPRALE